MYEVNVLAHINKSYGYKVNLAIIVSNNFYGHVTIESTFQMSVHEIQLGNQIKKPKL
jgi:hypothetical protein